MKDRFDSGVEFRLLKRTSPVTWVLDHRIAPETRACLCAMASRIPDGGIEARYLELLRSLGGSPDYPMDLWELEMALTTYPIPEKILGFIDAHIRKYGHSSPLELTGSPSVYVQGVSIVTAFESFDERLASGQEFSTRAGRVRDWPICYELAEHAGAVRADPVVKALRRYHDEMLEVFSAEVEAWKERYADPENRRADGIADDEPFRPALDRARWAIPSTVSTGVAHTGHLRAMSRVIEDARCLAECAPMVGDRVLEVWTQVADAYRAALPAFAGLGLKEAVVSEERRARMIPEHLTPGLVDEMEVPSSALAVVHLTMSGGADLPVRDGGVGSYADPIYNHVAQVGVKIPCSWAVVRDWNRHRPPKPWLLRVVTGPDGRLRLHESYSPISALGKSRTSELLQTASALFHTLMDMGHPQLAMMALPLGTKMYIAGQCGLRDALYMLELRSMARGKNFEYALQAEQLLGQLQQELRRMAPHVHQALWGQVARRG